MRFQKYLNLHFSAKLPADIGGGWTEATLYAVYEIYGNQAGQLLTAKDGTGSVYEATLDNHKEYTDFMCSGETVLPIITAATF